MTNMTITNKAKEEPEKTLREYGAPTRHATRKPIRVDDVEVEEFEIKTELIIKVQELAFKRQNDENPMRHVFHFSILCYIVGPRGVAKEFVYLKLFRCYLKDKAFVWLLALPHFGKTTWKECIKAFTQRILSFNKMSESRIVITNFMQKVGEIKFFSSLGEIFKFSLIQCLIMDSSIMLFYNTFMMVLIVKLSK
jgi:hypothetical protein